MKPKIKHSIDRQKLSQAMTAKKGKTPYRVISELTGVSSNTLYRMVEQLAEVDTEILLLVCDWLEMPFYEFLQIDGLETILSPKRKVLCMLLADKELEQNLDSFLLKADALLTLTK